ncbi:MAG: TIR domain-containing protein [Bacteroidetes bacterium]|nr:TIR domain-containing protein [Bacteroidota bacterium]
MTTSTDYTHADLTTLELAIPSIKSKIKNKRFVFDETTTGYEFVYLGNDKEDEKKDEKQQDPDLTELVFETPQPRLRYLNANNCGIKKMVVKNCPNLQTLFLFGNGMEEIRFEGAFPKLDLIDLSRNAISRIDLPVSDFPSLKHLYLHQNNLVDLSELAGFFAKEGFDFNFEKNETITAPPKEIVDGGKAKTVEWFKQALKYSTEKAYEAKILIVGEPGAGKTTLMELLFDRGFKVPQPEQPSTLGIEVRPNREFENPVKSLPKIKAHIWDFGGQDIQYMLHQYFLTDDSVYVLITDGRSGKTRYGYWFHIINLLGKKSPVLVLLNRHKKSDTVIPFDEKGFRDIFRELNIFNCGEIDFANLNRTWDAFEEKIASCLSSLPIVGQTIIKPWKKIREEIDILRNQKYILRDDFEEISRKCGLEDTSDIDFLLEYYHKIGIALNFNDANLQNTVFLDPNWITQAIYDVLSDTLVIDKNGEFNLHALYSHWLSKQCTEKHRQPYKNAECVFLLNLMLKDKFDICYELPYRPGNYVVPMKLPDSRTDYDLGKGDKLHFRFQYPFMPEGLMSRLIVRLHDRILGEKVWLTGAIFQDDDKKEPCTAEVLQQETTSEGLKYIGIKVAGSIAEKRRAFLRTIRKEVEHIHSNTFPYIVCNEMIVCNCETCDKSDTPNFYDLDYIKSNIEAGEKTIFCKIGKKRVAIDKMLHEIYANDEFFQGKEMSANKIFISYSTADRYLRKIFEQRLKVHLASAKNKFGTVWSDVEIPVGGDWNDKIQKALKESNIGILLVSPSFFGSKYCMGDEFKQMLERRKSEGYTIIPVLLRECNFQNNEDLKSIQFIKTYQSEYDRTDLERKDKLMPFDELAEIPEPQERLLNRYFLKVSAAIDQAI